jgi:hypothetical protein
MSEGEKTNQINVEQRRKDLSTIDRLFRDIKEYRRSEEFMKKLNFYSNFPYIGVYNAELVAQQRPGARFVLTAKKWAEMYDRVIKPNARPLIILVPFYPVEFLFDISDTKPRNERMSDDDYIIDRIINQYRASCTRNIGYYMYRVHENLPKYGIHLNSHYIVGSEIHAEIMADHSESLNVHVYKDFQVSNRNYFTVSVNSYSDEETLAAIFHELGHLFCHHLRHPWCKERFYPNEKEEKIIKEFEAEVVSHLVCSRLDINSNSAQYLANYFTDNDVIPDISLEHVFQAVDTIQSIASDYLSITDCLLYKHDQVFKDIVDKERKRRKEQKEKEIASKASM